MPLNNKTNSKRKKAVKNKRQSQFIKIQIIAIIIYLITFSIFSFVSLATDLNKNYVYYVSLVMIFLSSFSVGFISGTKIRQNGLIAGVIHALPMNLLLLIISLILNGFQVDIFALLTGIIMIVSSGIGGIVSVNIKVKK